MKEMQFSAFKTHKISEQRIGCLILSFLFSTREYKFVSMLFYRFMKIHNYCVSMRYVKKKNRPDISNGVIVCMYSFFFFVLHNET